LKKGKKKGKEGEGSRVLHGLLLCCRGRGAADPGKRGKGKKIGQEGKEKGGKKDDQGLSSASHFSIACSCLDRGGKKKKEGGKKVSEGEGKRGGGKKGRRKKMCPFLPLLFLQ